MGGWVGWWGWGGGAGGEAVHIQLATCLQTYTACRLVADRKCDMLEVCVYWFTGAGHTLRKYE